jgi:L-iditol 2-dehydrogenase
MQALVKTAPGPGHIEVREVAVPHAGPGEVRVAVIATGICGTDLHILDDEFPSRPPVIMGHEVTGVIDELGPGVAPQWHGRRVAIETYASTCQECDYCRSGRRNLCPERRSIGSHVDGGFTSYIVVPIHNAHGVDQSVSLLAGALYEPLACVAHALCDPAVASPGDSALVVGPGAMGLLAAQVLRAQGASVVLVGVDRDAQRLKTAGELGLLAMRSEDLQAVTPDGGFTVVAECSGAETGLSAALRSASKGGRLVQVGIFGRPVPVEFDLVFRKELKVTSGNASTPRSWRRAERLVQSGSVVLDGLVSASLPLPAWQEAFARARRGDGIKFLLEP